MKIKKNNSMRNYVILDNLIEGCQIISPDWQYIYVNEVAAKQNNLKKDDIIGKTVMEVYPGIEKTELFLKFKKCINERIPLSFENEFTFPNKHKAWFELKIEAIPEGMIILSTDITKHKKSEEALKEAYDNLELKVKSRTKKLEEAYEDLSESEEKFRELFNKADDMITLVEITENGMPGNFIEVNDVASRRLGYSKDEFMNMTPTDIIAPEKIPVMYNIAQEMKKNKNARFEIIHVTKDGRKIPVELNNHIFKLRGNDVILAISRDISDRKKYEKELKKSIKELEHSNEELQQFAYVSSHDLQEPLRTIASFTQLLERRYKGQLDENADEFMDYIVEAAKRMKAQIEGLLEYSRVVTKGEEVEQVDVNEILKYTLNSLDTQIREANAEITYDKLPNVMCDGLQLQRVFQNLISNAIKFRKQEESPKIYISAYKSEDGKEYVFSISDNSIGMEEQYLERIFTIFQRLHTRDVYEGTGIGLAIVRRIIERHGGHIWVESEFGVGSTFYFTLPIRDHEF